MSASRSITIPAAVNGVAGVTQYDGQGKVFACISCTADFNASFDDADQEDVSIGTVLGDPTRKLFRKITFYNSTASDIAVSFTVSSNALNPAILNSVGSITIAASKDAPTYTKSFALGYIGPNGSHLFNGLDNGKQRKQIVIQNLDPNMTLSIQDNSSNEGFSLKAGQVITLMTSGAIKVVNNYPSNNINCNVLETFYS